MYVFGSTMCGVKTYYGNMGSCTRGYSSVFFYISGVLW
jgi:hypothetical protein